MTTQFDTFSRATSSSSQGWNTTTIGTVVDTNDPQQMGRVRIVCPQWGDDWSAEVDDIPWAVYISPFGGTTTVGTRGPGIQTSDGAIAYGLWAVPKIGAQVLTICIDGNPTQRAYIGCMYDQHTPHTLPHGRFVANDHPELEKGSTQSTPYGPYSTTEQLIAPLASNVSQAFGTTRDPNFEYQTRFADYTVSRVDVTFLDQTYSKVPDDEDVDADKWTYTQGYGLSRSDPDGTSPHTSKNYESSIVSLTSAGFHAISMDDRQENCRIRMRTTAGHQIILDDTNERIYISTAQGNNWFEMDQFGNVDVYSATRVSIHAVSDINLTSDETVRIYGEKGVSVVSGQDITMQATTTISHKAGGVMKLQAVGTVNITGGGDIRCQAPRIDLNGPGPESADNAKLTSRIPTHEPYARTLTKDDFSHDPEHDYASDDVNRVERGRVIQRGMFWRR